MKAQAKEEQPAHPKALIPSESIAASQIIALDNSTKFDVSIETAQGTPLIVFQGIPAKTKAQAIHKAQQMLIFTAERS